MKNSLQNELYAEYSLFERRAPWRQIDHSLHGCSELSDFVQIHIKTPTFGRKSTDFCPNPYKNTHFWTKMFGKSEEMHYFCSEITIIDMEQISKINPAQYELLNMLSCISQDNDVADLKDLIVQFLNSRIQRELDQMWNEGTLSNERIVAWGHEHMRTPYRQKL